MKKVNWLCGMTLIGVALLSSGKVHAATNTPTVNNEPTITNTTNNSSDNTTAITSSTNSSQSSSETITSNAATNNDNNVATSSSTNTSGATNSNTNTKTDTNANATTNTANTAKVENTNGTVKINYTGKGQVAVWDNYEAPHKVIKYVAKNSEWKTYQVATLADNSQWYNLGGSQWVDGRYAIKNETSVPTNKPNNTAKVENISSTVNIQYTGKGQVAVWDNYEAPHKVIKYVPKNSSWKAYQVATLADNSQWYNLGGSQWVDGRYAVEANKVEDKPTTSIPNASGWTINNVNTNVTIAYSGKGQVAVWNGYSDGKKVVKYVPNASSWKVLKEAIPQNGYVWYNLGGDQWITSQYANVQKVANNGVVTTKTVAVPSQNSHQPYADPADMRKTDYWNKTSETKAHPNLRNVKDLWIRVSILGNRTYVMSGNTPVYTLYSSAGRIVNGKSLTPTGTYYVQPERGETFVGAHYYVSWKDHGVYLFHSTITNGYNGPYDMQAAKLLGTQPLSHGCIRLTVPDAKWFYQQLPVGTKVVIANN